jgi:crotonobetainyl-CoA:carnitine CoA-transferase CaiB-like acyl-CoA transferase
MRGVRGLRDLRVVDFSTGIAGAYATKLLADAGADVIKVEGPEGDPLRRWSATGADLRGEDGALFRFLHHSKRSVVGAPSDAGVRELVAGADLVVEGLEPDLGAALGLPGRFPGLVLLSITPWGRTGPYARRPASEFVIQAECGSIGARGLPGGEPFQAGGRTTEWVGGAFAAVAALAALRRARATGHGEHVDLSLLEAMNVAASTYMDLFWSLLGRPPVRGAAQSVETPSIEPTKDGYVGFCTNSAQQFSDFLLLIERPELREDQALFAVATRLARFAEWNAIVHAFTRRHTTAEIVERASALRIPVAPVNDGLRVRQHEHLVARGVFAKDPGGSFEHPLPPFLFDGERPPAARPAPRLGEHTGRIEPRRREARPEAGPPPLPLEGLRILDLTAWWAGPAATHVLATLGADVIHVESVQRPDGMRSTGGAFRATRERWWEWSFFFLSTNANKRGITLNLGDPRGVELAKRLVGACDLVVENFTPRVLEGWGLGWEAIRAANPRAILVRMPAFGLSGPWRDHTGFAQTMEQLSGLAWLTGHRDDQPRIQRGPCDPLAGLHAAFAALVALAERDAAGRGVHVEVPMVEAALHAAAEQVIEASAHGRVMERDGNRGPDAAPQGLYACRGHSAEAPRWLALSVASDGQWRALRAALGNPEWAAAPALATHAGRRAAHDAIDARLRAHFAGREREAAVEALVAAGVPAAAVVDPREAHRQPQLAARGFFEAVEHPEVGTHATPTVPFRYASVSRWIRRAAPTLGQHSREVLTELLGLSAAELDRLEAARVIGERPEGA